MASSGSEWMARSQRRRNAELSLLRRPSETGSHSTAGTASDRPDTMSPASPRSSSHSAKTDISYDQLHALQLQLRNNTAKIEANEQRMREIEESDRRMGTEIQDRLSSVMELNKRLNIVRDMLARAESVSKGHFGANETY